MTILFMTGFRFTILFIFQHDEVPNRKKDALLLSTTVVETTERGKVLRTIRYVFNDIPANIQAGREGIHPAPFGLTGG